MDRKELMQELQQSIKNRFMELEEDEKNLIRSSSGTPYAILMRKIIGDEILGALRSGDSTGTATQRRGLGTR
jgi:hypothetical protein|tara:strand:- start:6 stop:221 length:216 start_codon:yes stop_codon:yes gene_type:complete